MPSAMVPHFVVSNRSEDSGDVSTDAEQQMMSAMLILLSPLLPRIQIQMLQCIL